MSNPALGSYQYHHNAEEPALWRERREEKESIREREREKERISQQITEIYLRPTSSKHKMTLHKQKK